MLTQRSHLTTLYRQPFGMILDLYHLTMAYGYWRAGMHERRSVFHLFFRKAPFGQPHAIACGLQLAIDILENFRFGVDDIQYLGGLTGGDEKPLFDESFLNYLQRLRLSCDIHAIPEGTPVLPNQPLLRVEGPLPQAQLVESALLNVINFSTLAATKAARMTSAARGGEVLEFGLRRAQGIDGAITASRAAYIGGCHATSNVAAGRYYGIPVRGTHAHSWVMCFADELSAFRAYAQAMPGNCIFLVDTYDTLDGVRNAIVVGRELRSAGHDLLGIRLDSGDLSILSQQARRLLDEAGFTSTAIVASDNIDEFAIETLQARGAVVDVWGIGTRLATSYDQPALGGVYKLAALRNEEESWDFPLKISDTKIKTSIPGIHQVRRYFQPSGTPAGDMLYDLSLPFSDELHDQKQDSIVLMNEFHGEDLLIPVFSRGKRVYDSPSARALRDYALRQRALFEAIDWNGYPQGLHTALHKKRQSMIRRQQQQTQTQ